MKIFYASGRTPNNTRLPESQLWEINLFNTLESMGIDVIRPSYDVAEQYRNCRPRHECRRLQKVRSRYSRLFVDDVKRAHQKHGLDMVFTYFYSRHIDIEAVEEVKSLGIPIVNFYCNAVHQFHAIARIAPYFDYCMVPERDALPSYEEVGANAVHIQMAANPAFYRPHDVPYSYDVTFVGQRYLNRESIMVHLFANDIDCHAFGPKWNENSGGLSVCLRRLAARFSRSGSGVDGTRLPADHYHGFLSDEELVKMYSRSRISLNFSEVKMPDGSIKRHIRLRDFEGPMSGALFFTGYQDELQQYYDIDKEIVCYDTKEELLDKVQFYLSHPEEGEKVRQAGLARARRDHTWENRFRQLFGVMGLKL